MWRGEAPRSLDSFLDNQAVYLEKKINIKRHYISCYILDMKYYTFAIFLSSMSALAIHWHDKTPQQRIPFHVFPLYAQGRPGCPPTLHCFPIHVLPFTMGIASTYLYSQQLTSKYFTSLELFSLHCSGLELQRCLACSLFIF